MLTRLYNILQQNCQLDLTKPLVAGISGGPDSLFLLDALHRLGYRVVVAHFNHQLREAAGRDARHVEEFAARLNVSFALGSQDAGQFASENALSVEEAARLLRYRFLFEIAERYEAQAVAVGHTADDQVETVLMHLLRGAGMDGLTGMAARSLPNPWSQTIPLVRPMLPVWREEVLAYNAERGIAAIVDASNLDVAYYRNKLRHEVLPYLEKQQPEVRKLLWRTAEVLREDHLALDALVAEKWDVCIAGRGKGYVALNSDQIHTQPLAVQRRLLRQAIGVLLPGLRDVDFEAVRRGLAFIASERRNGVCSLTGGLFLLKEGQQVWLTSWEGSLPQASCPQLPSTEAMRLDCPGGFDLDDGWRLKVEAPVEMSTLPEGALTNRDPFQAWFDASLLTLPVYLRTRMAGDRIQPLGMLGHSLKVSDLMLNLIVPRRLRPDWPILCAGEEIIWIPGLRQGQPYHISEGTRQVVHMTILRESEEP